MYRALLGLLLCALVTPTWSAMIGFDLSGGNTFAVGQSFTLSLAGNGFTTPLDGGGVNLQFDPSILRIESVTVDTAVWDFAPLNGTVDNTNGVVEDILFNALLNPSPTGNFDIASVQFLALAGGPSSLFLSASASNPFSSAGVVLNPGTDFTFQQSTVTAGGTVPVPLPDTLGLFACGLAIVLALGRGPAGRTRRLTVRAR